MELVYAILIVIIIFGLMGICYIFYYNRLQDCKLKVDEAESIIDEGLREKYDTLKEFKKIIDKKVKTDKLSLKELDTLKDNDITNFDLDRKLTEFENTIVKLKDDYKDLRSDNSFNELIEKLRRINEKITAAKRYYNNYITLSNEYVRKFPSNIVAKFHNIKLKNFFDNKDLNDEKLDDFKL